MAGMATAPPKPTRWLATALIAIIILPALYLLGLGPVNSLWYYGLVPDQVSDFYFAPLTSITRYSPPHVISWLDWYLNLWLPDETRR